MYAASIAVVLVTMAATVFSSADEFMRLGKEQLAHGQLSDALASFHAAIESDGRNFLGHYHRGLTYLAMRNARKALNDFDRVLELEPSFKSVRLTRIEVLVKMADFEAAERDFDWFDRETDVSVSTADSKLIELRSRFDSMRNLRLQIDEVLLHENYETAASLIDSFLEQCPFDVKMFAVKAKVLLHLGSKRAAIDALRRVVQLDANDYSTYFTLANLLYEQGDWQSSLNEVRKCAFEDLHPDCYRFYKKLRKFAKSMQKAETAKKSQDYDSCVTKIDQLLADIELNDLIVFAVKKLQASCYLLAEDYLSTIRKCDEALAIVKDPDVYCDKAEAYIGLEHFDDALNNYNEALRLNDEHERAKTGKERAAKRKKISGKRDYYKILGVTRRSSDDEIKSAYRALAKKWHPDKHQGEAKQTAEKRFRDAADAKEVLLDKEKRRMFDAGADPLDPDQSSGHHHGGGSANHFHSFHGWGGNGGGGPSFFGSPDDVFRMFHGGGGGGGGGSGGRAPNTDGDGRGFRFSFHV